MIICCNLVLLSPDIPLIQNHGGEDLAYSDLTSVHGLKNGDKCTDMSTDGWLTVSKSPDEDALPVLDVDQ